MAITVLKRHLQRFSRTVRETVTCQFSTTDTAGTVTFSDRLANGIVTGLVKFGASAAGDVLFVSDASTGFVGGILTIPSTGLKINRCGSTQTSGLVFNITVENAQAV